MCLRSRPGHPASLFLKVPVPGPIWLFVNSFSQNTETLMDVLEDAAAHGLSTETWTVFYAPEGGLRMIANDEGSLESLEWRHGASEAWRTSQAHGKLRVEALAGRQIHILEKPAPQSYFRSLVPDTPLYTVVA